jgi:hypothetical protein
MVRFIAIIVSAIVFALIGLGAGFLAIENLNDPQQPDVVEPASSLHVMILAIAPTIGGAVLGLVVGCIAALITKKADDTN